MGCSPEEKKALIEVASKEYARLKDLHSQGYEEDLDNGIADIEEAMGNMKAIVNSKPKEIKDLGELIDPEIVTKINMNNPKVGKTSVDVISGVKYEDGKVEYKLRYPGGKKVYTLPSSRVTADEVDTTQLGRYGSEEGVDGTITREHEELKKAIWNDQKEAVKLFDKLVDVETEHTRGLRKLLKRITDPQAQVLNEFKVYLNDKAKETGGVAVPYGSNPHLILNIVDGSSANPSGMSAAEMYVHEMVHMSVEVARQFNKGPLAATIYELENMYEQAAKEIGKKELHEDPVKSEKLWDYMFGENAENGVSEFIAYGMTNEKLKAKLSTIKVKNREEKSTDTLWEIISDGIVKIWDTLRSMVNRNPADSMMDDRLGYLVSELWEHNNRSVEAAGTYEKMKRKSEEVKKKIDTKLIDLGSKAAEVIDSGAEVSERATKDTPIVGSVVSIGRKGVKLVSPYTDEKTTTAIAQTAREYEKALEEFGIGWLFKQEGVTQKVINYMKDDDSDVTRVEKLGLIAQNIDRHRSITISNIGGELLGKLKGTTHKQQTAITDIIVELDTRTLTKEYSTKEIQEMIADDNVLVKAIEKESEKLRSMIENEKLYNYYKSQTMGLGMYMATHASGASVNRNAADIVAMKGTKHANMMVEDAKAVKNLGEIVKIVDRLATMEGIGSSNSHSRDMVVEMMDTHTDAIETTMVFHSMHELLDRKFKRDNGISRPSVKGEIKDLKAGWIDSMVAPSDEASKAMMKKRGFTYQGETAVKGVGIYTTMAAGLAKFEKQAVAKINADKQLHNIVGVTNVLSKDKEASTEEAQKEIKRLKKNMNADIAAQMESPKMPVMNGYIAMTDRMEEVVNFGVSIDKDVYADAMKQDKKVPILMGKMIAEVKEKQEATVLNNVVLKEIYADMNENYRRGNEFGRKNRREYIEIGVDANNIGENKKEYADRMWKDMPHNIKMKVLQRPEGQRYIAVRRDMATSYFGRRSPSLLNAKVPFSKGKTIERMLNEHDMAYIPEYVKLAGDLWVEMVSLIKVDTVLKTPKVLLDNIHSNITYQTALGQTPWEAVGTQVSMFKATKEYLRAEKEASKLQLKREAGRATPDDRAKERRLRQRMKGSPVAPLMKAGMFTAVIEDLNLSELKSESRADVWVEKHTQRIPKQIKDIAKALYITEDTPLFGALMMVLQYSDFVFRAARYHYLMSQGYSESAAMKMITDEAVNYNRDLGAGLQWTKEMGPWMFFQYFFGANKSMINKSKSTPSSLIALAALNGGVPSPMDAAPWQKEFQYTMNGPFDLLFDQTQQHLLPPSAMEILGVID